MWTLGTLGRSHVPLALPTRIELSSHVNAATKNLTTPVFRAKMKSFLSFRLDAADQSLWHEGERVSIAPKAFDVLRYLVENPGRLVTADELLEALWPKTYVNPEILRKYILDIRKILGDRPDKPQFIETVTKRGYRFVAPVTDDSSLESPASPQSSLAPADPAEGIRLAQTAVEWRRSPWLVVATVLTLLVVVLVAGYFGLSRKKPAASNAAAPDTSIAVLPFADMSPTHDQEYFSDGLTEELINDLAKTPGLKVVGRSSSFRFKGKNEDLRTVARTLGVGNILEGSVRKEGNRVRIMADLTKASDGFQLWSETYDRDIGHIFAAQDDIAHDVTVALQSKLLNGGGAIPATPGPANPDAYQAYLRGQYFIARGQDKEDLDQALSYAEQAVKLDPVYAAAWAQRSQVLETLARVALIEGNDGFRRARESAQRAIALDPNSATAYLSLGLIQINHDWDWQGADASLRKAAQLAPGSAAVLNGRAYLARTLGDSDEAVALYKQAIALDPLRGNFHLALGYELYKLGRFEEAGGELQNAQDLNPQLSSLHLTRGKVLLAQNHPQEALAEMEKETGDWQKLSGQALAYYALGRRADSDNALKTLIATHQNDCAYQVTEVYAFRGENDQAFRWLARAIRQRDPGAPEIKTGLLVKELRQDPRYLQSLKQVHLPPSAAAS